MKREVETEKGRVRRSAAMRQKMPELERLEAELTEMKEILQRERETFFPILHKAPYGIILIDSGRRFLYVNPEFTRMTGYTVEDTHAERDWFHTASLFRQYSKEILKTWKMDVLDKGIERTLPVVCKNGEIRQIEFKPTLLDDGRIIVMLSDVTEKKQAEGELEKYRLRLEELVVERTDSLRNANEELHREIAERRRVEKEIQKLNDDLTRRAADLEGANKELEAFVYSVSHDLRTPLIGIHGLSRRLLERRDHPVDAKGKQFLSLIQKQAQKMLQLIDNLFALSRFNHQEIKPRSIDMGDLAETVYHELGSLSSDIPECPVQLKLGCLASAYGDPAMIRQVFFNLLSNAIKFSRPKETPVIEIDCISGREENTYYVKDNGVGFDMEQGGRLFRAFQRLHADKDFEGTGFGLAIVERIIRRQGGKVWAEGETGKGATFYFTLPNGP